MSPSRTSASRPPNHAVGQMSDSMIACSSVTSGGSATRPTFAYGIRAYSACRPSNPPASFGPPKKAVPARLPFGLALSHCEK